MDLCKGARAWLLLTPVAVASVSAWAQPQTLFSDNFESSTIKPQWSWVHLNKLTPFTQFSGRYSNNTIKLVVDAPQGPRGSDDGGAGEATAAGAVVMVGAVGVGVGGGQIDSILYTLSFDFYAIDTWDGNDTHNGPDRFEINNGKSKIFSETFGNVWLDQTFRAPDVGRWNMGYGAAPDSIYRQISVQWVQPLGEQVKLWIYDKGLQGLSDESWGIDNVNLKYEFVPTPGVLGVAGVGGVVAIRRKRR